MSVEREEASSGRVAIRRKQTVSELYSYSYSSSSSRGEMWMTKEVQVNGLLETGWRDLVGAIQHSKGYSTEHEVGGHQTGICHPRPSNSSQINR